MSLTKIPLYLNPASGSAARVRAQLQSDPRLEIHALSADKMTEAVRKQAEQGASRILVTGGDGTLALAANQLAGTKTALGVIPGGTLNHFAARHGIPSAPEAALELALTGTPQAVDAAYVNERLFINTSSVGAYVHFVQNREQLEKHLSYTLASLLAALRRWLRWRNIHLSLDGHDLKTPLVFIGVHERELSVPSLGQHRPDGKPGLHLITLHTNNRLHTLRLAFNAIMRGIDPLDLDSPMTTRVVQTVELNHRRRKRRAYVALDGELFLLRTPLRYCYAAGVLRVIKAPDRKTGEKT
ncbi:MAG: diacylglycerol kinase family protein [Thiolinea sp.]